MSEKFTLNEQKDKKEYNNILKRSAAGTVFSNTDFLDSFKLSYDLWNVKQGTEIKALLCFIKDKNKNIILNDYVIYSGIIFNLDNSRLETKIRSDKFKITEFVIKKITKIYKNIEFQLSTDFNDVRPFQWHNYHLKKNKFKIHNCFTTHINFSDENLEDFINTKTYKNMETVRRYDYRSALKENARVYQSTKLSHFLSFYKSLMKKQKIRLSETKLQKLHQSLKKILNLKIGSLFYVENSKKKVLYALIYLWDTKKAYYFLGAGSPDTSTSWQSIFGHCEIFKFLNKKMKINNVDLEGVNSPNRGWFKLSLGGSLDNYYRVVLKK